MFPAALAIVVNVFPLRERGKALALFFGIAGGLTAIGPILGGYLTQWTWRAIFWVNIPVAIIALVLIAVSKPKTQYQRAPIDYRGAVLIAAGIGLSIFGLQQSVPWGWSNPSTWICIIGGPGHHRRLRPGRAADRVAAHQGRDLPHPRLYGRERRAADRHDGLHPGLLLRQRVRADRAAQDRPRRPASSSSTSSSASSSPAQIGGRMLDREGAKRAVVIGCAIAAVGFGLWASKVDHADFSKQQIWVIVAGAGMGMMLGPANTDAVNRAGNLSYGEATGHHPDHPELRRQPGPGCARHDPVHQLPLAPDDVAAGHGRPERRRRGQPITQSQQGHGSVASIPHFVSLDFAHATAGGALRDVRDHGLRRRRGPVRPATRPPGGGAGRRRSRARRRPRSTDARCGVRGRALPRLRSRACRNLAPALHRRLPGRSRSRRQAWRTGAASGSLRGVAGGGRGRGHRLQRREQGQAGRAQRRGQQGDDRLVHPEPAVHETRPFEATYTTTGSSPATVVYAVDPSSGGLAFHETQTGRARPTSR